MSEALTAEIVPASSIVKSDNRKDWALMFLSGGGIVMTLYSAACLFILRGHPDYTFYLGLAAMIQIMLVFTGLMGLLVKRSLKISRSEIDISDFESGGLVSRPEAAEAAKQAVEELPRVDVGTNKQG